MDDPGQQERAVLEAIRANPLIGQQELAEALGLARQTVAAHVMRLVHAGHLTGGDDSPPAARSILCLGGAAIDRKYIARAPLVPATSNPVTGRRSFGGVARNVAENLARMGAATAFSSAVGDDENGQALLRHLGGLDVDVSGVAILPDRATAEYVAILDPDHDLALGLADMDIFADLGPAHVDRIAPHLAASAIVFADCNLPAETLAALIARRAGAGFRLAIDAVSAPKVQRLPQDLGGIDILFLNLDEARALMGRKDGAPAELAAALQARGARDIVLTLGARGALVQTGDRATHIAAIPAEPLDMTGAGDALIAGTLMRLLQGQDLARAVRTGVFLAARTAESVESVRPDLSPRFLAAAPSIAPEGA